jgi:hypothetical protein
MGGPRTLKLADRLTTPGSKNWNVTTCYHRASGLEGNIKRALKREWDGTGRIRFIWLSKETSGQLL